MMLLFSLVVVLVCCFKQIESQIQTEGNTGNVCFVVVVFFLYCFGKICFLCTSVRVCFNIKKYMYCHGGAVVSASDSLSKPFKS